MDEQLKELRRKRASRFLPFLLSIKQLTLAYMEFLLEVIGATGELDPEALYNRFEDLYRAHANKMDREYSRILHAIYAEREECSTDADYEAWLRVVRRRRHQQQMRDRLKDRRV